MVYWILFCLPLSYALFCNPGSHYTDSGCATCPIGHYGIIGNECIRCETGKFASNVGSTECQPCGRGKTNNDDSSGCIKCRPGTYNPDEVGYCIPCFPNTYNPDYGANICKPCFPEPSDLPSTPPCEVCEPGTYLDKRGMSKVEACDVCPIGTRTSDNSENKCLRCNPGSYNDQPEQEACKLCPPGTHNPHHLKTDIRDCVKCGKGKYSGPASVECLSCPEGYYNDQVRQPECKPCVAGTYNRHKGKTRQNDCLPCDKGQFSLSGSKECSLCPKGYYNDIIQQSRCTPCPLGTYANLEGQESCEKCSKGTYNDQEGRGTSCIPCSIGSYSDTEGSSSCSSCKVGSYTNSEGQSFCCGPGEYYAKGSDSCLDCNPLCKMCHGNSKNDCDACYEDIEHIVLDGNTCGCKKGYFEDSNRDVHNGYCQPCHSLCSSCEGTFDSCTSCISEDGIIQNANKCECNTPGYTEIVDVLTNKIKCIKCHYLCADCFGSLQTECTSCKKLEGVIFDKPNTCRCDNKGFYDVNKMKCEPCHISCQTCFGESSSECFTCNPAVAYPIAGQDNVCVFSCYTIDGFYLDVDICKRRFNYNNLACHPECKNCNGPERNQCLSCTSPSKVIHNHICVDVCPNGFFLSFGACLGTSC